MAYAPDYPYYFGVWAEEVGKALNGVAPRDIPIQQATKLTLMVNLKTAKAIGVDIPVGFLHTADVVIE
ncbi:hypothetical protein ACNJX9_16930 [Bradyrhizobium sp. DASA03076]|uniref:hypothetical protein n=1 Tax=Bradyrhizobium sp. BLXBL-03 TaxID=3395916 RepID=UPI003F7244CA